MRLRALNNQPLKVPLAEGGIPILGQEHLNTLPGATPLPASTLRLEVPPVPMLGHMALDELALIVGLVRNCEAESLLEIGTFDGLLVSNLLSNCPCLQRVETVDLPESDGILSTGKMVYPLDAPNMEMIGTCRIGERFAAHARRRLVTQRRTDSARLVPEDFQGPFNVVVVDGNHAYRAVRQDADLARHVVTSPGLIFYHDFGKFGPGSLPGVTRFLLELTESEPIHLYRLHSGQSLTSLVMQIILPLSV